MNLKENIGYDEKRLSSEGISKERKGNVIPLWDFCKLFVGVSSTFLGFLGPVADFTKSKISSHMVDLFIK